MIVPANVVEIISTIDNIRVVWISRYIATFKTCGGAPVLVANLITIRPAFYSYSGIILLCTQYAVWK